MSTKQDYEFAAKAAGIEGSWNPYGFIEYEDDEGYAQQWNPKDDDGDSRRLAVALGIMDNGVDFARYLSEYQSIPGSDRLAATRLAVFRAAVEIGKAIK